MVNETNYILEKIKLGGESVYEISKKTGIPKSRIYSWTQGRANPKHEDVQKLKHYLTVSAINETIDTESFTQKRNNQKTNAPKKNTVPFYDAEASAGLTETEMSPIHAPSGTIDIGDLLHDSEAALRIYGNSMIPSYPPGCVVGLARCNSKFIEPGEVYVIETRDRRMLKRIFYKDDNSDGDLLTCLSDNIMLFEGGARNGKLAYPPFDIPKNEIINIFTVTGVIKRNANSIIINRK